MRYGRNAPEGKRVIFHLNIVKIEADKKFFVVYRSVYPRKSDQGSGKSKYIAYL